MTVFPNIDEVLVGEYRVRTLNHEEFQKIFETYESIVFGRRSHAVVNQLLSDEEKRSVKALKVNMGKPLVLRIGIYHNDQPIGWHVGDQLSDQEFYMRNTGVLEQYRKQGIYTALLGKIIKIVSGCGFQIISSKHHLTNNPVLIPKLKAGFIITGIDLSDKHGTLAKLEYFTNPQRREIMNFRSGQYVSGECVSDWLSTRNSPNTI
jgi:hypothetical protein